MTKANASAGTAPAPATPDPALEKALLQIEEMQKALKAQQEAQAKREKELDAREAGMKTLDSATRADVEQKHKSKAEKMRDQLHAQPKVTIMIPLDSGENENATMPVTLNGYRYEIKKNIYVEVPKQIADVVMNALKQTNAAGQAFRTDIARPSKGGITVEEALL